MKFFFSSGIELRNDDISSIAVKDKIKEIITNEDKRHPLSDDTIKSLLKEDNIYISRRTVAKYRINMGLPNASQRKQL